MPEVTAVLSLPYIQPSQAQKHVTHNEALRSLDVITQPAVTSRSLTTPPGSPGLGDRYIVAAGATGDWAGRDGDIAWWDESLWAFVTPLPGWRAHVVSEARDVIFDAGAGWLDSDNFAFSATQMGINTSADSTNRLSVSAPATLFNHQGAGHQVKLNKATAGDTASLLYQTGFSGRAELGLAGDDNLHFKVSADGTSWTEALVVDAGTGHLSGAAVQASATDITAGRLARADFAYSPGNLLGNVTESGGVPTGAVIESGSNANGDYVRFANGTLICAREASIDALAITTASGSLFRSAPLTFNLPAAFAGKPWYSSATIVGSDNSDIRDNVLNVLPERGASGRSAKWRKVVFWSTVSASAAAGELTTINLLAIGRWF